MSSVDRLVQDGMARKGAAGDNEKITRALNGAISADANSVITAALIAGGFYLRTGATAGRTDTSDTGPNLDTAMPNLNQGETVSLQISVDVNQVITLAAGAGVTLRSTKATIAGNGSGVVYFTKTGVGTYDMRLV